jgi:hypothetical protein
MHYKAVKRGFQMIPKLQREPAIRNARKIVPSYPNLLLRYIVLGHLQADLGVCGRFLPLGGAVTRQLLKNVWHTCHTLGRMKLLPNT